MGNAKFMMQNSLVICFQYLLPDLNHGLPEILSFYSMAVSTHLGLNNIVHHKHLLKDSTIHHLEKKAIALLHSYSSVQ